MGTNLNFSTAFPPQSDDQSECGIQTLEDILTACVLDFTGKWDDHLPLLNSPTIIVILPYSMAQFEALSDRKCRSPICWTK